MLANAIAISLPFLSIPHKRLKFLICFCISNRLRFLVLSENRADEKILCRYKTIMKEQIPETNCKNCSNKFRPTKKWQKFCSVTCRNSFHWDDRIFVSEKHYDELVTKAEHWDKHILIVNNL